MKSRKSGFQSGRHPLLACKWRHSTQRTVAFFAALILLVATLQPAAAQPKQDFLAANIDTTVPPREDFFQYANGEWFKHNAIPEGRPVWGIMNVVTNDILSRQRQLIEAAAAKKAPRGSVEQLIGDFWFTGMDLATLNKQGLTPLQSDLDRIDRIRSIKDVIDFTAILHDRVYQESSGAYDRQPALFFGYVQQDEKNSDRWVYSLSQGGISMNTPEYYSGSNPGTVKVRARFREYLFKTFLRLDHNGDKAKASADEVYELEAKLAKAFYESDEYQRISVAELEQLAPTIDWVRYFRRIGITRLDSIMMTKPRFFQALDALLQQVPVEVWKDYLRFWLVKMNAPYLAEDIFGELFAYDSAYTGGLRPRDRWQRVLGAEGNRLGQPLAQLFVREYFSTAAKSRYQAVAESIREAFRDRIINLDWMSDSTKRSALLKLAKMKITIGFPDKWTEFSTMHLQRDSYVLNVTRASIWLHDQYIDKLNRPVDKSEPDLSWTMQDDASYDRHNNQVGLPPGFWGRVPGVSDEELDAAFIYGCTGTLLGHEISHGFDSEGRKYDANGNEVDWWTAKDADIFNQRARALIDEYNEFMPVEGLHVDGRRSLPENMADLAGVRIALDAFKKTEQFKKNEKIGRFTPLQRFFLAFAYSWANQRKTDSIIARLKLGFYAPERERVNGVLMNIPEFYEAFDVKPGDRMYRPENARAKIW
jgi:putative endopeptidase